MNENNNINQNNNPNPNTPVTPATHTTQPVNQVDGTDVNVQGPRVVTPSAETNINAAAFNTHEKTKKVYIESNNKPKGLSIGLIIFLLFLAGFVIFLPEISAMVEKYTSKVVKEEIVNGQLRCELVDRTSNFTITNERNFKFKNSQVTSYSFVTITKGDAKKDEEELTELYDQCEKLDILVNSNQLSGVEIGCEYLEDTFTKRESVDLYAVDMKDFKTSYSEAGGTLPVDVSGGDNIDNVQTMMQQQKFTCTKIK